jgi:hypothetical protein
MATTPTDRETAERLPDLPARISTRHYTNGLINARPSDEGWSFPKHREQEGQYVRADIHDAAVARAE